MKNVFLTNYSRITFLDKIKDSLSKCENFYFSVSFIKKAGLILLIDDIRLALQRGAKGKIITSTYQNFTDIASLNEFLIFMNEYDNFQCHLDFNSFGIKGFHTKGYLFEYQDSYEFIVGSSNITRFALINNIEWNVSLTSKEKENHYVDAIEEFNSLWSKTEKLTKELIDNYSLQLEFAIEKWDMDYLSINENKKIVPNYMQRKALKEIRRYRDIGVNKALVVAATGSGKTYLAAFDARNFEAKRVLFIVHRDTILKEAIKTFSDVFGKERTYGLYNGKSKEIDCDFIFSTNSTMSKNYQLFSKDEFDYLIIDEVHHAVADTYRKIIDYFEPQFMLGLTATPERMDNESVFELFEKNVPYELRLRDALENDLIVPFKYYGIRDIQIDYSEQDLRKLINQIADDIHCEFIKENIEKYHPPGKLKAIGFCRTIEHARIMAEQMSQLGYTTTYLTGKNDTGERLNAFKSLQDENNRLEIIFTVDLLNEGVDIPAINMVLFLRPTESSTIFIQQLGRGLRKHIGKEFLTVLDFIGNSYTRSVQIALALGSLSKSTIIEKTLLRSLVNDDFKSIDLPIEINIDQLSKDEILRYIEKTNFNRKDLLIKDYFNFKNYYKIDRYPTHMDYLDYDSAPDLLRFIKNNKKDSRCYYNFLYENKEDVPNFNQEQINFLVNLSNLLPLVRPYEFSIIKFMLEGGEDYNSLIIELEERFSNFNLDQFNHSIKFISNKLWEDEEKNNREPLIEVVDGKFKFVNIDFEDEAFKDHVFDLLSYGLTRYDIEFGEYDGDFKLYGNYQTEQIKMVMCESGLMQVQGTIVKDDGTVYILAGLKKDRIKDDKKYLDYNDKFLDSKTFQWESTTNVNLTNSQGLKLINSKIAHVFVRKTEKEDKLTLPYTYVGTGQLTKPRAGNKSKETLLFDIKMDYEFPDYLRYDFMIPEGEKG